jgi:hypothetical protein
MHDIELDLNQLVYGSELGLFDLELFQSDWLQHVQLQAK